MVYAFGSPPRSPSPHRRCNTPFGSLQRFHKSGLKVSASTDLAGDESFSGSEDLDEDTHTHSSILLLVTLLMNSSSNPSDPPDPPDPQYHTQELHIQSHGYQSSQSPASSTCNGNRRGSSLVSGCHLWTRHNTLLWLHLVSSSTTLKIVVSVVSPIEIQHINVFSKSQSLVSLVKSSSDVNELRSALVDIRSLLESFSCISVSYILCSANVVTHGLAQSALAFALFVYSVL